jgi:hypothetical protein
MLIFCLSRFLQCQKYQVGKDIKKMENYRKFLLSLFISVSCKSFS